MTASEVKAGNLTTNELLEVVLEALRDLSDKQDEIMEKIDNLSRDGSDFSVTEFE